MGDEEKNEKRIYFHLCSHCFLAHSIEVCRTRNKLKGFPFLRLYFGIGQQLTVKSEDQEEEEAKSQREREGERDNKQMGGTETGTSTN